MSLLRLPTTRLLRNFSKKKHVPFFDGDPLPEKLVKWVNGAFS